MKYEQIQALLDRYWEGETSLEEERALKAYFNAGPIDERLQNVAPLFRALKEEQLIELKTRAKTATIRPQMYQWAAAASVALLLAAGWWMWPKATQQQMDPIARQPVAPATPAVPVPTPLPQESVAAVQPQKTLVNKKPAKRKPQPINKSNEQEIDQETAMAMAEIKAALALVSAKLDKGKTQAVKKASYLEVVEKVPKRKEG
ncbi:MAG TPA: hypothetical protein VK168_17665 [Saprospiraceae bacterium]|nr:hypothetical protein [Saprospiraceae bacterium]